MWNVLVTDVDGVLNTGRFLYDDCGKKFKEFGPHDSDAIKFFRTLGVDVIAISADKRGFTITKQRMDDMGVEINLVTEKERMDWVSTRFDVSRIAFVGDGYFDIPVMKSVNCSYAPENALDIVKKHADIVLPCKGGSGVLMAVFEDFLSKHDQDKFNSYLDGEYR